MKNKILLGLVVAILLLSMTFMVSAITTTLVKPANNDKYTYQVVTFNLSINPAGLNMTNYTARIWDAITNASYTYVNKYWGTPTCYQESPVPILGSYTPPNPSSYFSDACEDLKYNGDIAWVGGSCGSWTSSWGGWDGDWGNNPPFSVPAYTYCGGLYTLFEYANYTKPTDAISMVWRAKDEQSQNDITVPSQCFNAGSKVQLRMTLYIGVNFQYACWNGTAWGNGTSTANMFTNTHSGASIFWEEAAIWTMNWSTSTLTAQKSIQFNWTLPDDSYKWGTTACNTGGCALSATNNSFLLDTVYPTVTILSPSTSITYSYPGFNYSLNYSIVDTNIQSCWLEYNNTNTTIPCTTNSSFLQDGLSANKFTIWANDSVGHVSNASRTMNYTVFQNNIAFSPITSETQYETYIYNITLGTTNYTSISANWTYDGVTSSSAMTQNGNNIFFTNNYYVPVGVTFGNKTFYWTLYLTNSSGTTVYNSTSSNQVIIEAKYEICSPSNNVTFLNVNYRDEATGDYVNATVDNSIWYYSIFLPTTKTYTYTQTGNVTMNRSFCFYPPNFGITVTEATYQYGDAAGGYVTKVYPFRTVVLSNLSSTYTLYMIKLSDSGTTPVTFQAISSQTNTVLSGIRVQAARYVQGVLTVVDDGYTDNAGTVLYYMSPIAAYTITATGGGCSELVSTVTPTSSQYNLVLNCGGGTANQTFISQLEGITYTRTPADGVNKPGNIEFTYNINSVLHNMTRVKFEVIDATTGEIYISNDSTTTTSSCTPTNCYLTATFPTYTGDNIKARYYVALNGTADSDLILIEGDAYWRFIVINQNNSVNAIGRLMMNVQDFFNTWGTSTPNCLVYTDHDSCINNTACKWVNTTLWATKESPNYGKEDVLCVARDDLNKAEFNRIVTIFFLLTVVLFILGRTTGYELNHPGAFVVMMTAIIWVLSLYGMFTFAGLTQYDFFNQYIFALTSSCIGLGYMISVVRRYSG